MNPEDSTEPNCEGIFLRMQDNKVVRKSLQRLEMSWQRCDAISEIEFGESLVLEFSNK